MWYAASSVADASPNGTSGARRILAAAAVSGDCIAAGDVVVVGEATVTPTGESPPRGLLMVVELDMVVANTHTLSVAHTRRR